jgi:hypothetical protein
LPNGVLGRLCLLLSVDDWHIRNSDAEEIVTTKSVSELDQRFDEGPTLKVTIMVLVALPLSRYPLTLGEELDEGS